MGKCISAGSVTYRTIRKGIEMTKKKTNRRGFLARLAGLLSACAMPFGVSLPRALASEKKAKKSECCYYGMGVDVRKCIGCGRCVNACKNENDVSREPFFFRTWVERYVIRRGGKVEVESPNGGIDGFPPLEERQGIMRSFFVPKLCNQCDNAPCVQVCPVGATYMSPEGIVLMDKDYCIGCRYCIQACPYGARYMHPKDRVADKCTFCYHRLTKGLKPACVEVCPSQARVIGDTNKVSSPLTRFRRVNEIHVLKAGLNTAPKVYYAHLDGVVT